MSVPLPDVEEVSQLKNGVVYHFRTNEIYTDMGFELQSKETIVSFMDDAAPDTGDIAGNHVFSKSDATIDTNIEEFFRRPVRTNVTTWNESDAVGVKYSMDIWNLWASNTAVKNKLNNYSWFRGDLRVRFQVTVSPFYYGLMKACYQPLPNFKATTIVAAANNSHLVPYSQRPHTDIVAGGNDSFDLVIPFIYQQNWLNVQSAQAFTDLGKLDMIIYAPLASANGVTGNGIQIATYCWVENIQLSGASVGFSVQSSERDEYGEGVVSRPASWVASAASYFEDIPIIGPFATATRIGAGAVSAIASLFGFTNVPVIEPSDPMHPESFPKMASSEIGFPIEKLTLDPKNELSIDPRIVGLPDGKDEMMISTICERESYLCAATWTDASAVDDILYWTRVNPSLLNFETTALGYKLYYTPMSYVFDKFFNWRGSIIFRFQVVCSKYHRGKLRISFDPSGYTGKNLGTDSITSNVVHTAIIDLSTTNDIEFEVPYQQATQFLYNIRDPTIQNWGTNSVIPTAPYPYRPLDDNGMLSIRVLNELTAPVASTSVQLLVFVKAGKDLEFANPTDEDHGNRFSFFTPQSAELSVEGTEDKITLAPVLSEPDKQYLVHFGENIRSMRQLLRRYEYHSIDGITPTNTVNQYSYWIKYFKRMPMSPGYCPSAYNSANKLSGPGTYPYNFCNMTMLSWFSNMYLAYRGSVNWTFNPTSQRLLSNLRAFRSPAFVGSNGVLTYTGDYTTPSRIASSVYNRSPGTGGQALTNQNTQAGLNIQCPHYSIYKFQSTNPILANQGMDSDGSTYDNFIIEGEFTTPTTLDLSTVSIHGYCAAGTDFSLLYFLNTPTVWYYSSAPTAP